VSSIIKESLEKRSSSIIARREPSEQDLPSFYTYVRDETGKVKRTEVLFMVGNSAILASFILSGILALYGAIGCSMLFQKARKGINRQYEEYLDRMRSLAHTKN